MTANDGGKVTQLPSQAEPATWDRKLRLVFPDDQLEYKPADGSICRACKDSQDKVCGKHTKAECPVCHQWMTTAHGHLTYVGHAGITTRLLDVDPAWTWEWAHHDVDPDVLKAALATGNAEIVRMVIDNAPPLAHPSGAWIKLTIHDDDGNPVTRLGFGDAQGKSGPNAAKELIGDALRNASMRFGVATYLWSKSDEAVEARGGREIRPAARKGKAAQSGEPERSPENVQGTPGQAAAIALAKLAYHLATNAEGATVADLRAKVHEQGRKKGLLTMPVPNPFDTEGKTVQLTKVIAEAKSRIEKAVAAERADSPGDGHGN